MSTHSEFLDMLDLAAEGELAAAESRRLADHLEGCADCRAAERRTVSLHRALAEAKLPVREGFRAQVMAALPQAEWQRAASRTPHEAAAAPTTPRRALAWAAGLFLLLGTASALLLVAATGGGSALPGGGLLAAVGEMAIAGLVTGAGLLGASWSGVGLAVGQLFASAPGTLVAFALLLAFLSGLLFVLLRRPRARQAAARSSDG